MAGFFRYHYTVVARNCDWQNPLATTEWDRISQWMFLLGGAISCK